MAKEDKRLYMDYGGWENRGKEKAEAPELLHRESDMSEGETRGGMPGCGQPGEDSQETRAPAELTHRESWTRSCRCCEPSHGGLRGERGDMTWGQKRRVVARRQMAQKPQLGRGRRFQI